VRKLFLGLASQEIKKKGGEKKLKEVWQAERKKKKLKRGGKDGKKVVRSIASIIPDIRIGYNSPHSIILCWGWQQPVPIHDE